MGFNDEDIARTAAACRKPTVSAVGHEIDWTILDYICDKRAATPTAAAEIVFPDVRTLMFQIMKYEESISRNVKDKTERYTETLEYIRNSKGFNNVKILCSQSSDNLEKYYKFLNQTIIQKIDKEKQNLVYLADKIDNNNPLASLKKGYALVFKDDKPVKADDKIKKNDRILVRTHLQELSCVVESTKTVRKKGTE